VALCLVHRKRENKEKLLIRAIGYSCGPSPFVSEDEHSVLRMFILIRQSTNSSCYATVVISVDDHFVVVYCVYIICDCSFSTSIRKYRCVDACFHAYAHAVIDIFTVWNCGNVPVGFTPSVCPHVTSWQLRNRFSLNVMIGSFIKLSQFFILLKIRQQLFALFSEDLYVFLHTFH
jgi:hypothetical protein